MRTKTILLGSVSAIATAAAGAGQAQAAVIPAGDDGYTYSVQGGLAMTPAEMSLAGAYDELNSASGFMGKFGSGYATLDDLDQAFGYNAAMSIGKDLGNGWDIRMGATANATGESSGFVSAYSYGSSFSDTGTSGYSGSAWVSAYVMASEQFSFQALDFEVGYTPILTDTLSVRLFGGIRAVHSLYEQSVGSGIGYNYEASGYSAGGYASGAPTFPYFFGLSGFSGATAYSGASGWFEQSGSFGVDIYREVKTEFFGAGPRVGVEVSKRLEGTNFGLSGRLAGSLLFGKQTTSYTGYISASAYVSGADGSYSGGNRTTVNSYTSGSSYYSAFSSSYSVDKKIADVEAQIGLDYYLDDSTALTIGYQAEKMIDLDDEDGVNHLTHGAFIKLSGSF